MSLHFNVSKSLKRVNLRNVMATRIVHITTPPSANSMLSPEAEIDSELIALYDRINIGFEFVDLERVSDAGHKEVAFTVKKVNSSVDAFTRLRLLSQNSLVINDATDIDFGSVDENHRLLPNTGDEFKWKLVQRIKQQAISIMQVVLIGYFGEMDYEVLNLLEAILVANKGSASDFTADGISEFVKFAHYIWDLAINVFNQHIANGMNVSIRNTPAKSRWDYYGLTETAVSFKVVGFNPDLSPLKIIADLFTSQLSENDAYELYENNVLRPNPHYKKPKPAADDTSQDNNEWLANLKKLQGIGAGKGKDDNVAKVGAYQNANVLLKFQQKFGSKIADTISNIFRLVWDAEGAFIMIPFTIWFLHGPYGLVLLLIADSSEILNGILKFMTQKPRPFWVIKHLKNITHKWNKSYSFPSGHSQFSASFMCTLLILFGEYLPWYLILFMILLPITAGLSRIYLGVHGIDCVICGWIIGVLFSITMCFIFPSLFNWFQNIHIASAVIFIVLIGVILPYLLLYTIQKLFPSHTVETFRNWTLTAINNTFSDSDEYNFEELILQPRGINKYDFEIWSFFGGALGVVILQNTQIVPGFVENMCVVSDNLHDLILTVVVGYSVLMILLFPTVFVLPSKLRKYNRNKLAIFCRVCASFLTGIWVTCLCPIVSYVIFGLHC